MNDCATSMLARAVLDAASHDGLPVLLVRHARTADNAAKVLVGRRDVPLDDVGRAQAQRLQGVLAPLTPSLVVTSPLRRARQTLHGLGEPTVEPRLMEVHHGEIEGLQELEFRSRFAAFLEEWTADPEHTCIPGGESLGQAAARSYPAFEDLVAGHAGAGPVVVCSHQLVIATLLCRCQGLPLARYGDFTCRNTAINVLSYREGRWTLLLSDHLDHLDG